MDLLGWRLSGRGKEALLETLSVPEIIDFMVEAPVINVHRLLVCVLELPPHVSLNEQLRELLCWFVVHGSSEVSSAESRDTL
jgi:hypothetical protein